MKKNRNKGIRFEPQEKLNFKQKQEMMAKKTRKGKNKFDRNTSKEKLKNNVNDSPKYLC